ncbi:SDR family NAD(P)-dependent oxidoreductase [Streptomyces sp. NBC_01013]|uniref:SDR family NAD(P)-dependent oxidoreductase n=1 Tax=Streptomyces sp. NBC_01013 TaxID=2903718 RepID=UPI00386D4766|nr:SDR family NAD(P)-dependent oxidoreductase [Streptomyces sp. NBC_01013]
MGRGRPVAVITGATSGLGRIAAFELAGRGYRIRAVARSRTRVEALVADLKTVTNEPVDVFHAGLGLISDAPSGGGDRRVLPLPALGRSGQQTPACVALRSASPPRASRG